MNLFKKMIDKTHITNNHITTLCGKVVKGKNYVGKDITKPTCPVCVDRQLQLENNLKLLEQQFKKDNYEF